MADDKKIAEGLAYLAGLAKFGLAPTLERIEYLLRAFGRPHLKYPVVHIAGTNGKGSTARYIAQILSEAGMATGLFTSPHLERYNERICVNGQPIGDSDLLSLIDQMKPCAAAAVSAVGHPTEFEMSTAMAFLHFAQAAVDVAVVEVGMGGLWDSTNVVDPVVSIITPVGMDHMSRLGPTIADIAAQKAGIIKQGRPVVAAPQSTAALSVILKTAKDKNAPVYHLPGGGGCVSDVAIHTDVDIIANGWDEAGGRFALRAPDWAWDNLQTRLLGRHQIDNAATAATAVRVLMQAGFPITLEHVRRGLHNTFWPGRLEMLPGKPTLLLDGAHNAEGAAVLAQALTDLFARRRIIMVIGVLAEKPVLAELRILLPHTAAVVCTAPAHGRTPPLPPRELAEHVSMVARDRTDLPVLVEPTAVAAVERALSMAEQHDIVCVCGSLHLIGEVRAHFVETKDNQAVMP